MFLKIMLQGLKQGGKEHLEMYMLSWGGGIHNTHYIRETFSLSHRHDTEQNSQGD